ncbi:hypothetical protein AURDEDRAFT_131651, partial [Auricularia subglabra TFB-10046 SS5]
MLSLQLSRARCSVLLCSSTGYACRWSLFIVAAPRTLVRESQDAFPTVRGDRALQLGVRGIVLFSLHLHSTVPWRSWYGRRKQLVIAYHPARSHPMPNMPGNGCNACNSRDRQFLLVDK